MVSIGEIQTFLGNLMSLGYGTPPKGQIISECPYEIIVWTKIPTKKLPRFLPKPLRRGQIKKFIKPIMLISIIRGYLT